MAPVTPIRTLLYATDLSDGSVHALRYAVHLADALDGRLHLLHALEPISAEARITLQSYVTDPELLAQATTRRAELARQMMAERQHEFWVEVGEDAARLRDRIADIQVLEGNPADVILRHSVQISADLVLMGSHEHGFNHTFLGRIAQRVLRRSRIPTLIIPYPDN
ncbi:universal stress protein [uncultured Paracoccus sp.]|uniref:universal stress protein n=1 Tax=uncultured Paracoccus sp. TaxID=189685 RepID=UPI00262B62D0|nr:universal stress protein [uncultured Paracoccus sp.]